MLVTGCVMIFLQLFLILFVYFLWVFEGFANPKYRYAKSSTIVLTYELLGSLVLVPKIMMVVVKFDKK